LFDTRTYASGVVRNVDWDMTRRAPRTVQAYYTPSGGGAAVFWQNDAYTRDQAGNVTSITDQVPATGQAQCATYDGRNRLTQAWTVNPATSPCSTVPADTSTVWNTGTSPYRVKWTHTPAGNLASTATASVSGSTSSFTTRTYAYADTSSPNAVTSVAPALATTTGSDTYVYDAAGRMTSRTITPTDEPVHAIGTERGPPPHLSVQRSNSPTPLSHTALGSAREQPRTTATPP
jgi:hypothetical protein